MQCTRARLHALSLWWDRLDHERQRSERQQHERFLPTEEKEDEWTAMLHSRKFVKRASQWGFSINSSTTSLHSSSSTVLNNNNNGNNPRNSKSNAGGTISQLEHMDEKLTTMQQVLTPFEIQRLQQNAYHVVRIPKRFVL